MKMFKSSLARLPKHARFAYKPRYYNPDNDPENREEQKRISIRKASYLLPEEGLKGSLGQLRYSGRQRPERNRRTFRLALLLITLAVTWAVLHYDIHIVLGSGLILIPLVLFIRETNKP